MDRIRPSLMAMAAGICCLAGCASYVMEIPDGFRRYEDTWDFKMITADGVMLKGREVDNYPEADLTFWVDALKRHLKERGYAFKSEECFKTDQGLDGCVAEFLLPYGNEDWVLSECLFVVDETIIVLETAGPFERYAKVEKGLHDALKTFRPSS